MFHSDLQVSVTVFGCKLGWRLRKQTAAILKTRAEYHAIT